MINEFEYYHGVALRDIIVTSKVGISIETKNFFGRVNSYLLNGRVGIYIKHSSKRLSPWQYSFSVANLQELLELRRAAKSVWLIFICGPDGLVAVSLRDFVSITETRPGGVAPIRIDRGRNKMYRVSGNAGALPFRKARGVVPIVADVIPATAESVLEANSSECDSIDADSDSASKEFVPESANGISDSDVREAGPPWANSGSVLSGSHSNSTNTTDNF
jgi:hypothetical protein